MPLKNISANSQQMRPEVFTIVAICTTASLGNGLRCFQCGSRKVNNNITPLDDLENHECSDDKDFGTLVDCGTTESGGHAVCLKVIQSTLGFTTSPRHGGRGR